MYDFLYAKLSNYNVVSIMQALDLAEDGTFLYCTLALIMDVGHLPCKLAERSKEAVYMYVGQPEFIWRV